MILGYKNVLKCIIKKIPYVFCRISVNNFHLNMKWISKQYYIYKFIKIIYPNYSFLLFFYENSKIINKMISNKNIYDVFKNNLMEYYKQVKNEKKMFIHCIATTCHLLDDDFVKIIMDDLLNTNDINYLYWLGMDISHTTFKEGNGIYSNFYNKRKLVLGRIVQNSNIIKPQKKYSYKSSLKICILSYQLHSDIHNSSQRVCSMFANNLINYYDDIVVLCTDSTCQSINEKRNYFTILKTNNSNVKHKYIKELFNPSVKIKYVNGKNCIERSQNMINTLYDYNPDIIVDITDEYSPLSFYYSQDYFTMYVPMRGAASSQYYSNILGVPFKYLNTNKNFNNCIDMQKVVNWSFPEYIPQQKGEFTKRDIGLNNNQFCVISIGNNECFSSDFVDEICSLLTKNNNIVWLLVGTNGSDYLHQKYNELINDNRIIEWGYEKNLAGICKACDVHLRYNMTGGSGGTAIAAMQGLPIVMTNYICDASRWLGLDYSVIDNYHDLAEDIQRLYDDKVYYNDRKLITKKLISKAIDSPEKWEELAAKLKSAYERWQANQYV